MSLGEAGDAQLVSSGSHCSADGSANRTVEGDVLVTDRAELDALAGCETITGDLTIQVYPDTDLRALGALREVGGGPSSTA